MKKLFELNVGDVFNLAADSWSLSPKKKRDEFLIIRKYFMGDRFADLNYNWGFGMSNAPNIFQCSGYITKDLGNRGYFIPRDDIDVIFVRKEIKEGDTLKQISSGKLFVVDYTIGDDVMLKGMLKGARPLDLRHFELITNDVCNMKTFKDFPHLCSKCGHPSYNGLFKVECSNLNCENFK